MIAFSKTFLTFGLLLFLSLAPACKGSSKEPSQGENFNAKTETRTPRIHFITWNEDYLPTLKAEIPRFENETGIDVEWELLSEDIVREKVLVDLTSGSGRYDIVLTDVWILPEHVSLDYLEPLDPFIKRDASFDRSVWYATFLNALTYEQHLYALPTESFGAALVYRKDLFKKYRVPIPQTIDELVSAARKLTLDTDGDGSIDTYGVVSRGKAGEEPTIIVSGFAYAFGGTWFEYGAAMAKDIRRLKAKPTFNSPAFLKGFETYCDLLKRYGPPGVKDYTWYEMIEDGRKGAAAMILYAGFNVGALDKPDIGMRGKYAAALPARGPRGTIQEAFAMGYGINRHSRNKDAAWTFLKFITGPTFMKSVVENSATSIPIKALRESPTYRTLHPYRTTDGIFVLEKNLSLIDWNYMPHLPEYSVIANLLGTATSEVIAGKKDARKALDEVTSAVEIIMRRAGYYEEHSN